MTCDEALNLASPRIDGELPAGEAAALDAHLAGCASCREAVEAAELQDAGLVRAFAPRRATAAQLAERVLAELNENRGSQQSPARRGRTLATWWFGAVGGLAAGIVVAIVWHRVAVGPGATVPVRPALAPPVGRLTLATDRVFVCPDGSNDWQPLARGEPVAARARVRTSDQAKCELELAGGARLRLNAETEACFTDDRDVRVASGQLWSCVPRGSGPVRVTAGPAIVTAGKAGGTTGTATQFDIATGGPGTNAAPTVTVLAGAAEVSEGGNSFPTTVSGGQTLQPMTGPDRTGCRPVTDPVTATAWQDELLMLKPADDPEVLARVGQLLARIAAERATAPPAAGSPGPVEQDVRARGSAWAAPLVCYTCPPNPRPATSSPEARRTAVRLLADLAPPRCVPDLIELLSDDDADVRSHAAMGLVRLTGQDLGFPSDRCAADHDRAALAAWRTWWAANCGRYLTTSSAGASSRP